MPNRPESGEGPLIAYFGLTAFFLVYVPFSKICHYLYYPFTRFYLGPRRSATGALCRRRPAVRRSRAGGGHEARQKTGPSGVVEAPLDPRTAGPGQGGRSAFGRRTAGSGPTSPADNVGRFLDLLGKRISRPLAVSMTACVHCGLCAESCHYFLARPDDPTMTPVWKADQIRKIFKRHVDWTGRVAPWWVKAGVRPRRRGPQPPQEHRLRQLQRLPPLHVQLPDGRRHGPPRPVHPGPADRARHRPRGRLQRQPRPVGDGQPDGRLRAGLPGDAGMDARRGPRRSSATTPSTSRSTSRTATSSTRSIPGRSSSTPGRSPRPPRSSTWPASPGPCPAGAGTRPTSASSPATTGSAAFVARNVYEAADRLRAKRIVISECGHGYRSTRWEGYTWAGYDQDAADGVGRRHPPALSSRRAGSRSIPPRIPTR
ncbi:MAG: hypothetical protein M0C28_49015 [Candidatus Moduliflexus flocculans]|nr:hypothetical protein [Candidatus Moduliflexus flocculans]